MNISRREILKISTILATTSALYGYSNIVTSKQHKQQNNILTNTIFKNRNKTRVVIVGGGWSGLSLAKHIKLYAKHSEVILVEQKSQFQSCPMSNLWLVDKIDLEFLTYDYLQAARENNYEFLNATAIGLDKQNNILFTSEGSIEYDYIAFAPGIDYDYSFWSNDEKLHRRLLKEYPAAFKPGSEHITLRNKILNFKGGNFILTVPSGNYRCLPAPYERACIIADYFKSKKLDAKVILLDENNDITIKEHGFHTAFNKLYKDYIEYYPNSKIENIDLDLKKVETEFEEFTFDDASFYPHIRGAKILEICGIAKDTIYNKLEADIDPITYEVNGYPNIYVSGDARPMGFSKSGNTSNTEAKYVAKLIAAKINKTKPPKWESPITVCISLVSINPQRGIFIHSEYAYNKNKNSFSFATPVTNEIWQGETGLKNAQSAHDWATALYADMFNS